MKIILLAAISADGKIAEREGQTSLDWTSKEDTRFFVEKTKEAGVVVMGRKTFEMIGKPLKGRRLVVLSNRRGPLTPPALPYANPLRLPLGKGEMTLHAPPEGTIEFTNLPPHELIKQLETEGHDGVVVAGGASVYAQFLKQGLVTDLFLTIEPVLFGRGIPFASDFERINMQLVEVRPLGEQAVLLHYLLTGVF